MIYMYKYHFLCNFGYNNVLKLQFCQYDIILVMIGLGSSWTFREDCTFYRSQVRLRQINN